MSKKVIVDFATHLTSVRELLIEKLGEKEGETHFNLLSKLLLLNIKTRAILFELDNLLELYSTKIFEITTKFYSEKYHFDYDPDSLEILETVKSINGNPEHTISDEVTLLYYVGLFHKIENYENEILVFYNDLNKKNFKDLKSIGLEFHNKKELFCDRDRIRIICNSIKHNNFYPKPELLNYYPYLSKDKKLSLKNFNTIVDLELIKLYIKHFNYLAVFKSAFDSFIILNNIGFASLKTINTYFNEFTNEQIYNEQKSNLSYLKQ